MTSDRGGSEHWARSLKVAPTSPGIQPHRAQKLMDHRCHRPGRARLTPDLVIRLRRIEWSRWHSFFVQTRCAQGTVVQGAYLQQVLPVDKAPPAPPDGECVTTTKTYWKTMGLAAATED